MAIFGLKWPIFDEKRAKTPNPNPKMAKKKHCILSKNTIELN